MVKILFKSREFPTGEVVLEFEEFPIAAWIKHPSGRAHLYVTAGRKDSALSNVPLPLFRHFGYDDHDCCYFIPSKAVVHSYEPAANNLEQK